MPRARMVLADVEFRAAGVSLPWFVELLTPHLGICPGLERDDAGELRYALRWWALCHVWTDQSEKAFATVLLTIEQEIPPNDLLDRPSLTLERLPLKTFADWLEHQADWSSERASLRLDELPNEVLAQVDAFRANPNLWEVPPAGALESGRRIPNGGNRQQLD